MIFYKYQGTGNDFILIDNRNTIFDRKNTQLVAQLCHRHFGIGADGLMLLQNKQNADFEMVYYNSDGNESSMCGNGGRCIVAFAKQLGIIKERASFIAIDGSHDAWINENNWVGLKMMDVNQIEQEGKEYFLNTGSPHYVVSVNDIEHVDVSQEGKKIRYNDRFREKGTNVNFIERKKDFLFVRTYERGVEAETLSCGTGVTASAIVAALQGFATNENSCSVNTLGGDLTVSFNKKNNQQFTDIWLEGPATFVFKGEFHL